MNRQQITCMLMALTVSCSRAPIKNSSQLNEVSQSKLVELLKQRKLTESFRMATALDLDLGLQLDETDEAETATQYYLLTCRPKSAYKSIQKISDSKNRALFQAALYALISVERPPVPKDKGDVADISNDAIHLPLQNEVWADEWEDIHPNFSCSNMPLVENLEQRRHFRELALQTFQSVPEELMLRDSNLIALALDVGYEFKKTDLAEKILAQASSNTYLGRLQHFDKVITANSIKVQKQNKDGIFLSELNLEHLDTKPQSIKIPILLQ